MKRELHLVNPRCVKTFAHQAACFGNTVTSLQPHLRRRWLIIPAVLLLELAFFSLLKCRPASMLWLRHSPRLPLVATSASVARATLFSFAGATRSSFRDDFRADVLQQCYAAGGRSLPVDCREARCGSNTSATLGLFLGSQFCRQPRGDSFTRRSVSDCMVAGAILVFFWRRTASVQYMWHLSADPVSYSVFVDRRRVKNGASIEGALSGPHHGSELITGASSSLGIVYIYTHTPAGLITGASSMLKPSALTT
ncbi:Xyloglucan galactosyltransferase KATAMARI1-like protein [Nymphaea thermarum]|nr:Xyloglucan galactosyltransferase KATAMARI1-like protein [Nymphaea thermarum]